MRPLLLLPSVLLCLAATRPGAASASKPEVATDADGDRLTVAQVTTASEKRIMVHGGGGPAAQESHTLRVGGLLEVKDPRNAKDPRIVAVSGALEVGGALDAKGHALLDDKFMVVRSTHATWLPRSETDLVPLKSRELRLVAPADRIAQWVLQVRAVRALDESTEEVPAAAVATGWTKVGDGLSVRVKEAKVDKRRKATLRLEYKRDGAGVGGGAFVRRVDWLSADGAVMGGDTWTGGEGPLAREGVFQSEVLIRVKPGETVGVSKLKLTVVTKAEEAVMKFELGPLFGK